MYLIDQKVIVDTTDELAAQRKDQLVTAAQAGVPEAFAEFHATYSRRLYKTIVGITRNREDAEDALQETFLRAYLAIHTFEGRSGIYSWLTRIAINSTLRLLQRRRSRPETLFDTYLDARADALFLEIADSAPNPEEVYDQRQRRLKVLRAIRNLNPKLREPIRMQLTRGFSVREIGRALDISEAAVKTRLHRARLRLSAVLKSKHFAAHRDDSFSAIAKSDGVPSVVDRSRRCRSNLMPSTREEERMLLHDH